jgi:hypothetical protein
MIRSNGSTFFYPELIKLVTCKHSYWQNGFKTHEKYSPLPYKEEREPPFVVGQGIN